MAPLLEVSDLNVKFQSHSRKVHALRGVSFHLERQEVLAIVGESGCGKSVTAKSIMQLLPKGIASITKGSILFDGKDITRLNRNEMAKLRGSKMGMIFQDPMTSLNPTMKVGEQIAEGLIIHRGMSRHQAMAKAVELVEMVGIPNPKIRCKQYPHQLSGGMRQRIVIAMALVCQPELLIADEPTTALDVTIQAQIIDLLRDLQKKLGMSIILITHDLGVVANFAHRVMVMYAGKVVESGTVEDIFYRAKHPYTWGLLQSVPRLDNDDAQPLRAIEGTPPDLSHPPSGCAFSDRCPYVMDVCEQYNPDQWVLSQHHRAACWLLDPRAPKVEIPIHSEKVS
ncbi:ABC transporter ATP-binding protein [Microaerobacter geothermalis]|uniref:ABC transporter ATP-binding protein n=1 Tax=Microaerobacter geothermalis TaxID=674972 RepID=UPI001F2799EA|nr:ABC transporter ATP-binding protein [Microaerobacter geothermalis]MCF6094121.1 ABC transporter ATP-binding protein [Microaerobacter geothermalis]